MKRTRNLFSIVLSVILLLTGCGGASIPTTDSAHEINYYLALGPTNLDAQATFSGENMAVLASFVEGLMTRDENNHIVPGIAERYEVSDDGLTYRFYLRKNAKWSNGTPVTADDFVFAWQRMITPETGSEAVFLLLDCMNLAGAHEIFYNGAPVNTLGIKEVDMNTLEVHLNAPCPYFTELVSNPTLSPCNREFYYEHAKEYGKNSESIISCGPFVIDYYEPLAMQLHMKKNPYYYAADEVRVPGVNFQELSDVQQLIMSFEKGEADVIPISGEQQEVSEGDPRLITTPAGSISYVIVNHDNKSLQNKNILTAMSLCVNREMIQKNLLKEGYIPLTRVIPAEFFYEPDGTDFGADQNRYSEICGYDPALAGKYWDAGLKELGIKEITVEYLTASDTNTFMDILKNDWEKNLPGFELKYRAVPPKAYLQELRDGHFDMVGYGWTADVADPTAFFNLFIGDGPQNFGHFSNEEFDSLLKECSRNPVAGDPAARALKLHEAEDILMNEGAIIPLYAMGTAQLVSDEIEGLIFTPINPPFNFRYAYRREDE